MRKVKCTIEITAEYHKYDKEVTNRSADKHIRRWIKESMNDLRHIPIYAEKDENGSYIEDCTRKVTIKFK